MKTTLVLLTTLVGCTRVEERQMSFERLVDPAPAARALPRCELPPVGDTAGWRREQYEPVALPPGFELDPTGRDRDGPHHGGTYWKDASGRTFRSIGGHWGVSDHPDACHAFLNGALAVIVVGSDSSGHWVDAWPVSRSALTTSRFDANGFDADDQELFLRILQTYRRPAGS